MQAKEKKICSFTQNGTRLQLIQKTECRKSKATDKNGEQLDYYMLYYQVRLNRKIIQTSISEYQMRKLFATYCQNIVLQLKIY